MKSEVSITQDSLQEVAEYRQLRRTSGPRNTRGSNAVTLAILCFLSLRPILDLGPTYGRGGGANSVVGALLVVAIVWWLWTKRQFLIKPSPSVCAAGLLGVAAMLSVLGSFSPTASLMLAIRVITITLLFAYGEQQQRLDQRMIWRVLFAVLASTVLAGFVGALQALDIVALPDAAVGSIDEDLTRPPGPYPAAPVFSTHMYLGLVLSVIVSASLWRSSRWRVLLPHVAAMAGMFAWLMVTNRSRSPIVALAVAIGVFLVLRYRWLGLGAWIVIALAAIALIDPGSIRADELGAGADVGAEADTFAWRVGYWQANLPRFWDNPITGIGLGRVSQLNDGGNPPHSTVVQTIVEMGLFGMFSYTLFVLLLARDLLRRVIDAQERTVHIVALGALALCAGYFLIGLSENLLTQLVTSGPVAVVAGCALGFGHSDQKTSLS